MSIGQKTNNPGNLTVPNSSSIIYPGQTGVYSSGGLNYATFPDPQTGASALTGYINDNVGSSPNLLNTPSQLAGYYLNGNPDSVQPTANNPHPSGWLSTLTNALGIGANDPIPSGSTSVIANAIQIAEGNASLGQLFSLPGSSNADSIGNGTISLPNINIPGTNISAAGLTGTSTNTGDPVSSAAVAAVNAANASFNPFSQFFTFLTNLFSLNTGERAIAVLIGGGLILITITVLIAENKTVQQTVSKVAAVAA